MIQIKGVARSGINVAACLSKWGGMDNREIRRMLEAGVIIIAVWSFGYCVYLLFSQ